MRKVVFVLILGHFSPPPPLLGPSKPSTGTDCHIFPSKHADTRIFGKSAKLGYSLRELCSCAQCAHYICGEKKRELVWILSGVFSMCLSVCPSVCVPFFTPPLYWAIKSFAFLLSDTYEINQYFIGPNRNNNRAIFVQFERIVKALCRLSLCRSGTIIGCSSSNNICRAASMY